MNILNLLLIWIFFGALSAYIAHKKGRSGPLWFTIGLFTGLLGVILIFFLPPQRAGENAKYSLFNLLRSKTAQSQPAPKPSFSPEPLTNNLFLTPWYYLDEKREQQGPFDNIIHLLNSQTIHENSFVWTEGMPKWKRVKDLPEYEKFLSSSSSQQN